MSDVIKEPKKELNKEASSHQPLKGTPLADAKGVPKSSLDKFKFVVTPGPHVKDSETTGKIMFWVVGSLAPITVGVIYLFGMPALVVLLSALVGAVGGEAFLQKVTKKPISILDGSAFITGLLLALTLPPNINWWIPFIGGFIAVSLGKYIFGGLGFNVFNPALVARAILVLSWPKLMTSAYASTITIDAVSKATPLFLLKQAREGVIHLTNDKIWLLSKSFLFGNKASVLGESSLILLIIGAVILLYRRIITWHTPVTFIGTVLILNFFLKGDPIFYIVAGGLTLGAFFMATDYVTSPLTKRGKLIYGFGCGTVTVLLRFFSNWTEGVMFALLFMNSFAPLIDRYTKPKLYGAVKEKANA